MGAAIKKALALGLSIFLVSEAWGSPSFVVGHSCKNSGSGAATTTACSASISVTAGNVVVCTGALGANTAPTSITHTGTAAITWAVLSTMQKFDTTSTQEIIGGWGNVTGTGTATPAFNFASSSFRDIICGEFTGTQAVTDGSNSIANAAAGTGTNATKSGQITTTANGDLLVGSVQDGSDNTTAWTAGTLSVTNTKVDCETLTSGFETCMEWGVQTTAASLTESDWTGNSATARSTGNILAIKAAAGVAATPGFSKKDKLTKLGQI